MAGAKTQPALGCSPMEIIPLADLSDRRRHEKCRGEHIVRSSLTECAHGAYHAGLKDKVAAITGAARGIGSAIAKRSAAEGASVIVNYATRETEAERTLATIAARRGKGSSFRQTSPRHPKSRTSLLPQKNASTGWILW